MVVKRLVIAIFNVLFPPVAVALLAGPNEDLLVNSCLFLCAVIPSHIHGFYISCTYFNRKRRVRKGLWPGRRRWGIFSERVQSGGVGRREMERLRRENEEGLGKVGSRGSGRSGRSSRVNTAPASPVDQYENWDGNRNGSGAGRDRRSQKYRGGQQMQEVPASPVSQYENWNGNGSGRARSSQRYSGGGQLQEGPASPIIQHENWNGNPRDRRSQRYGGRPMQEASSRRESRRAVY